jgi:peptidoglycan hydrolase-like protein with peptidoglycan-binding domain
VTRVELAAVLRRRTRLAVAEGDPAASNGDEPPRRPRRAALAALALAAFAAGGVVLSWLGAGDDRSPRRTGSGAGATATVTRQTLVDRETVEGVLGYSDSRTVVNRLASGSGGGSGDGAGALPSGSGATASTGTSGGAATSFVSYSPSQEERSDQPPREDEGDKRPSEEDGPGGDRPDDGGDGRTEDGGDGRSEDDGDDRSADTGDDRSDDGADAPSGEAPQGEGEPSAGGSDSGAPPSGDGSGDDPAEGSGTLTGLARPGSVVERGGALYEVDDDPVVLMYGGTPAYRTLEQGVEDGPDVRQLEENLAALGFDPGTVDAEFSSSTAAAVRDWQESRGLEETGSVELGRVVFLAGARRIGERKASVGQVASDGAEVLETTSTRRVVKVELDVSLQALVRKGAGVEVTLPGGRAVRGRITRVGRVAREKDTGDGATDPSAAGGSTDQELVIDVTVVLRSRKGIGRLDQAPVSVGIARESKRNALTVPVDALLARRGGGYALELAGSRRIVPVETGLFASGLVEVSGAEVRAGTRVVVPG